MNKTLVRPPIKNYHHRSRLTDALIEQVGREVEATGTLPSRVLIASGIPKGTATDWLRIGNGDHPRYPHPPARYVKLAEVSSEALNRWHNNELERIKESGHWRERQNVLGARFPEYKDVPIQSQDYSQVGAVAEIMMRLVAGALEPEDTRDALPVPVDGDFKALPEGEEEEAS